jgi:hypothetical protein
LWGVYFDFHVLEGVVYPVTGASGIAIDATVNTAATYIHAVLGRQNAFICLEMQGLPPPSVLPPCLVFRILCRAALCYTKQVKRQSDGGWLYLFISVANVL